MKRLLDISPWGDPSYFTYDHSDDTYTIERVQDVGAIIENNKQLQNDTDGYSPSRDIRSVASVPFTVFEGWLKADGLTWNDYWTRMDKKEQSSYRARRLLSNEWGKLRTSSGNL